MLKSMYWDTPEKAISGGADFIHKHLIKHRSKIHCIV